jgi:hypothetical protein
MHFYKKETSERINLLFTLMILQFLSQLARELREKFMHSLLKENVNKTGDY